MATHDPSVYTARGRLSFPVWTYKEAVARNAAAPKNIQRQPGQERPEINLVLNQTQLDKLLNHLNTVYFPWLEQNAAAGEKRQALEPADIKKIRRVFDDLEIQPPYIPLKKVSEKTLELMPDAVAMLKIVGPIGGDWTKQAVVRSEQELLVPEDDILNFPVLRKLGATVHDLYPGCIAGVTINFYPFKSGSLPGFSASGTSCVFLDDADSFSGGVDADEDALFLDE